MLLRYFSHELRTPLNSVYVGVSILLTELKHLGSREHSQDSLVETAEDTQQSCQLTADILNGMVLYDSLLNGLVTLEKSVFDPWKHFCDVVNPFRVQVSVFWIGEVKEVEP